MGRIHLSRLSQGIALIVGLALGLSCLSLATAAGKNNWDPPAIRAWPDHDEVVLNRELLAKFIKIGEELFAARFNTLDGAGRPDSTGDSKPTIRSTETAPMFIRTAGPDANSCAGCHNQPLVGGAGDFAANVFVGAHFTDPVTHSIHPTVTNERNTISVFGGGAIETLAREMTTELLATRREALAKARREKREIVVPLQSKGVSFGELVARPDGTYSPEGIRGVDLDLVVKPFGAKGVAVSIREFTNFALNQHHGIQSQERFGWERTGVRDFDGDGVEVEFTVGHLSALSLYQASLAPPEKAIPATREEMSEILLGERKFKEVGCGECHVPALPLNSWWFTEPNPYNRPGNLVPQDVAGEIMIPLRVAPRTGVFEGTDGRPWVAAFTDLKRHKICDEWDRHFCNEKLPQDFVPPDEFLTAKLWDVGSSSPYGHRGDLTTVSEAILHHSGEARAVKEAFLELPDEEKAAVVTFLLSLRVEPDSTAEARR